MKIDRYKIYTLDGYTYENFVSLDRKELEMILTWRNHAEIRKWMMNTAPITLEDHLAYVESLKQRDDAYYWLVRRGGIPVGVLNIMRRYSRRYWRTGVLFGTGSIESRPRNFTIAELQKIVFEYIRF